MSQGNRRRQPGAFTLVELLLVISIIAILIMIFLPMYSGIRTTITRMHCAMNLANCQKIILQYASNNNSFLPNFGSTNRIDFGIFEDFTSTRSQFPMVDELKRYGASASIFTCPASPAWQDLTFTGKNVPSLDTLGFPDLVSPLATWDSTLNPPNGFYSGGSNKFVYTFGYCFTNRGVGSFRDNRRMPCTVSDPGELPLAADSIYFDGTNWVGLYHEASVHQGDPDYIYYDSKTHTMDTTKLVPLTSFTTSVVSSGFNATQGYPSVGGGNVVFLSGVCQWFEMGDILPGVGSAPVQHQPMFSGPPRAPWYYYFGRMPQSASSKLSN